MSLYIKRTSPLIKHLLTVLFPMLSREELNELLGSYPKLIETVPDKNELTQLKGLLFFLNTRLGCAFFFKSLNKIENLSNEAIESFFERNLKSRILLKRKAAFNILSLLGVLITRGNNSATKKLWSSMRYEYKINQFSYKYKRNKFAGKEVDVAVIGSGSGGGVAAGIISR